MVRAGVLGPGVPWKAWLALPAGGRSGEWRRSVASDGFGGSGVSRLFGGALPLRYGVRCAVAVLPSVHPAPCTLHVVHCSPLCTQRCAHCIVHSVFVVHMFSSFFLVKKADLQPPLVTTTAAGHPPTGYPPTAVGCPSSAVQLCTQILNWLLDGPIFF